jgi:hypothetical protein
MGIGGITHVGIVGPLLLVAAWLGALAYFWWSVAWHLRERRATFNVFIWQHGKLEEAVNELVHYQAVQS